MYKFWKRCNSVIVTRKSVRQFKGCYFLTFWMKILWYNYPIYIIFGIIIPRTSRYNIISKASFIFKSIKIKECPFPFLQQIYVHLCLDLKIMFWLLSSDALQVLLLVCPYFCFVQCFTSICLYGPINSLIKSYKYLSIFILSILYNGTDLYEIFSQASR